MHRTVLVMCALGTVSGTVIAQASVSGNPVEPVTAIVDALRTHSIVALGDGGHGNEQGHAFRMALIHDDRFSRLVDDIVVEFGNSRYQETVYAFVAGKQVPIQTLQKAWQDTTIAETTWDVPIYEEFVRAVRSINEKSPGHHMRLLLGDPPIDWNEIRDASAIVQYDQQRDQFAANLIQREVVAKGHRAVLVFGDGHLWRWRRAVPL